MARGTRALARAAALAALALVLQGSTTCHVHSCTGDGCDDDDGAGDDGGHTETLLLVPFPGRPLAPLLFVLPVDPAPARGRRAR